MYGYPPLTKENILKFVSRYDIFRAYIINFKKINHLFKSELRNDVNPTCAIYLKGDNLKYKDFASPEILDCFSYVMVKYNLTFYEAMQRIALDFQLKLSFNPTINTSSLKATTYNYTISEEDRKKSVIKVIPRKWSELDKRYWNSKYGITIKELQKYNVLPLEGFFINGTYFHSPNNYKAITYGYYLGTNEQGELWKIYRPFKEKGKGKWFTNVSNEDVILGNDQLVESDLLIITKSLKDIIIFSKLNLVAISPQAEGHLIQESVLNTLKERYKKIIVIFDNDKSGKGNAEKYKELYGFNTYFFPTETKDASDFVEHYGLEGLNNYLVENVYEISSSNSRVGIHLQGSK